MIDIKPLSKVILWLDMLGKLEFEPIALVVQFKDGDSALAYMQTDEPRALQCTEIALDKLKTRIAAIFTEAEAQAKAQKESNVADFQLPPIDGPDEPPLVN